MGLRGSLQRPPETRSGARSRLLRPLFDGRGVRAWARALLFVLLWALGVAALFLTLHLLGSAVPALQRGLQAVARRVKAGGPFSPEFIIVYELLMLACALFATWAMTWLDGRPFTDVGLRPRRRASDLLAGFAVGFALLGLLVAALLVLGYGRLGPSTVALGMAVRNGLVWAVAALLVGAQEEILFRGYLFTLLRERFGFWTGALAVTVVFMLAHGHNAGENPVGLISVGVTSVFFCLAIRRTGSLWWVIGCHAGWDWAEDYFFGSADSGTHSLGRLFTLMPHGARLLSGGTDGPEGSLLSLVVIVIGILLLPMLIRSRTAALHT